MNYNFQIQEPDCKVAPPPLTTKKKIKKIKGGGRNRSKKLMRV